MSKQIAHHPDPDTLLLFLDGELEPRQVSRTQEHLSACWQCRTELEELQRTIGDAVRYRQTVFQSCFPSPPAPWCDIRSRMTDVDATLGSSSFFRGNLKSIGTVVRNPRWWAPALAAGLALAVVFVQFRNTPAVSAAELLRRATIAADSQPQKQRKIQFRTATHRLTRVTGRNVKAQIVLSKNDAESLAVIEAMFASARYNSADPLSAESYSAWRGNLSSKTDRVETEDDCFVLNTSTSDGEVLQASLKLRTSDLHPVEGTLTFRNNQLLEMKEISEDVALTTSGAEASSSESAAPAVHRAESTKAPAFPGATISDELGVFATLRRLDADLGEPIEVVRRDDKVLVTGIGVAPERQAQLRQELASSRSVVVQFAEPNPAQVPASTDRDRAAPDVSKPSAAMLQIEKYFGSRLAFDQFADQTFAISDAIMARAHALRRLSERFPVEIDSKLTADDRRLLVSMRLEHFGALSSKTEGLQQRMGPVLGSLGASPTDQPRLQSPPTWQAATEEIFRDARQVEIQLGILLGGAAGETTPAQVLSGLNLLRSKINAYESLLLAAQ
jgi:hypothetical protein